MPPLPKDHAEPQTAPAAAHVLLFLSKVAENDGAANSARRPAGMFGERVPRFSRRRFFTPLGSVPDSRLAHLGRGEIKAGRRRFEGQKRGGKRTGPAWQRGPEAGGGRIRGRGNGELGHTNRLSRNMDNRPQHGCPPTHPPAHLIRARRCNLGPLYLCQAEVCGEVSRSHLQKNPLFSLRLRSKSY